MFGISAINMLLLLAVLLCTVAVFGVVWHHERRFAENENKLIECCTQMRSYIENLHGRLQKTEMILDGKPLTNERWLTNENSLPRENKFKAKIAAEDAAAATEDNKIITLYNATEEETDYLHPEDATLCSLPMLEEDLIIVSDDDEESYTEDIWEIQKLNYHSQVPIEFNQIEDLSDAGADDQEDDDGDAEQEDDDDNSEYANLIIPQFEEAAIPVLECNPFGEFIIPDEHALQTDMVEEYSADFAEDVAANDAEDADDLEEYEDCPIRIHILSAPSTACEETSVLSFDVTEEQMCPITEEAFTSTEASTDDIVVTADDAACSADIDGAEDNKELENENDDNNNDTIIVIEDSQREDHAVAAAKQPQDYANMKLPQLKQLAIHRGIRNINKYNKPDLIKLLTAEA